MPHYYRKVLKIKAEDSPLVRRELLRQQGVPEAQWPAPVPGVISWAEYQKRRLTWDRIRQIIGLDAEFYEGAEVLLYPPEWLDLAEQVAAKLLGQPRRAKAIGVDTAEGGDRTSMSAGDERGIIEVVSRKTPDTNEIIGEVIGFGQRHGAPAEDWCLDRGGGGKQHADRLRAMGYPVRTVAFGETVSPDPRRGRGKLAERVGAREDRYAYKTRRVEMAGELSDLLDPSINPQGFGIPAAKCPGDPYARLRYQLSKYPRKYDGEGRMELPPKHKKSKDSKEPCLVDLIGYSPDEADSVFLCVHGLLHRANRPKAGAV